MWTWLRKFWKRPAALHTGNRDSARGMGPAEVRTQAGEIVELSRLAEMLHSEDDEFLTRVRRIRSEMTELCALAQRPEFARLSGERLRSLDKGLALARRQLLDVVRDAPAPTSTLQ